MYIASVFSSLIENIQYKVAYMTELLLRLFGYTVSYAQVSAHSFAFLQLCNDILSAAKVIYREDL
jgi:hypothetical protein